MTSTESREIQMAGENPETHMGATEALVSVRKSQSQHKKSEHYFPLAMSPRMLTPRAESITITIFRPINTS